MSSQRPSDTALASTFTPTSHTKPTPSLDPSNQKLPSGLNILIIGASRGIGAGIAHAYAQAGASTIILAARSSSTASLEAVAKEAQSKTSSSSSSSGTNTTTILKTETVDITSASSVSALAERVKQETHNKLDIVILNSGYSGPVVLRIDDGSPQDFKDVFDVNVQGTYLVSHYFVPLLRETKGTFIAVGSLAACITKGNIANTAYCVSKFAQARLMEFLAEQYGEEGVLAVAVHPGAVLTEMADETCPDSFRSYLTDDVGLCGAFCVWLSREKRMWLNGRLLSAKWDVEELAEKKDQIQEKDLLKFGLRLENN